MTINELPGLNAILNSISTVLIIAGWLLIRAGNRKAHIVCMASALVTSVLFLASYLTYHMAKEGVVTKFTAEGWPRLLYFAILIPHVVLAFVNVPLVAATLIPALRMRFERHKVLARWTLPVWLYVSVTGVLVYLMLYRWFPAEVTQ